MRVSLDDTASVLLNLSAGVSDAPRTKNIRNVSRPKAGSVPMGVSPLLFRRKNGSLVSEAHLALIHCGCVTDHFVARAKRGGVIAKANGALVMGARVTRYIIANVDRTLSGFRHWLFSR